MGRGKRRLAGLALSLALCSHSAFAVMLALDAGSEGGGDTAFNGLLMQGVDTPQIAVLLLHGSGAGIDSAPLSDLRYSLNAAGYTTLSVEHGLAVSARHLFDYPSRDPPQLLREAHARIRTAINKLGDLGVENVVLLGFGQGATLAAAHIAHGQRDELPVAGLMAVGMNAGHSDALLLRKVEVPMLDIFGDADIAARQGAADRARAYRQGTGKAYTQYMVKCAGAGECVAADFGGHVDILDNRVNNWMARHAPLPLIALPSPLTLTLLGLAALIGALLSRYRIPSSSSA